MGSPVAAIAFFTGLVCFWIVGIIFWVIRGDRRWWVIVLLAFMWGAWQYWLLWKVGVWSVRKFLADLDKKKTKLSGTTTTTTSP